MEEKYSIVFMPDNATIEEVKKMKLQLAEKIGWYNSKNALAHITICEFHSSDIEIIKKQIYRIASTCSPFEVELDGYDSYPNGAFFIKPSEHSKVALKNIMKKITTSLILKQIYKSNEPHLSIARKLDHEKLSIAYNLFLKTTLHFQCDKVYLRKFNSNLKQFEIIDSFHFEGIVNTLNIQGSLF